MLKRPDEWRSQPLTSCDANGEVAQEEHISVLHVTLQEPHFITVLLTQFSSLQKIEHIIAYILRFSKLKRSTSFTSKTLLPNEIFEARTALIKFVQKEVFSDLIQNLKINKSIPKPFRKLAVFLDDPGVLRVGGRLRKCILPFEVKHPALLPKIHRFTDLIVEHTHNSNFHPGSKTLHNLLLQTVWILNPRNAIHRCISFKHAFGMR